MSSALRKPPASSSPNLPTAQSERSLHQNLSFQVDPVKARPWIPILCGNSRASKNPCVYYVCGNRVFGGLIVLSGL
jgi:hypothetical protein